MEGMKRCNDIKCPEDGRLQPLNNFKKYSNGYDGKCKPCRKIYNKSRNTTDSVVIDINVPTREGRDHYRDPLTVSLAGLTIKWG